jgi:hypothetical protein
MHRLRTCYTRSAAVADVWLQRHATAVLGLDVESCCDHGFDVLQLAARSGHVLVYQRSGAGTQPSPTMRAVLENACLTKAGVGVAADARRILCQWNVQVNNCVDLAAAHRAQAKAPQLDSLQALALHYAGIPAWKHLKRRQQQWQRKRRPQSWQLPLSLAQQTYAAMDAYAGALVYAAMLEK